MDGYRGKLRQLHTNILTNIEQVQEQTARILQEQERDLLRAFRARLFDVQTELEKANARASSGAQEWVEKCKRLEKELEWARETADRLDRHNQALTRENTQLKTQFKTQEDDREYLVRQLVAAKKDNARLRQDLAASQQELFELRQAHDELAARATEALATRMASSDGSAGAAGMPGTGSAVGAGRGDDAGPRSGGPASASASAGGGGAGLGDELRRLQETVSRQKRLLESERRQLRQSRQALATEMQAHTEIERLFRRCVLDVQADIAARKAHALSLPSVPSAGDAAAVSAASHHLPGRPSDAEAATAVPIEALTADDRREIVRRLLQQEEVLRRLQEAAFPPTSVALGTATSSAAAPGSAGSAIGPVSMPPGSAGTTGMRGVSYARSPMPSTGSAAPSPRGMPTLASDLRTGLSLPAVPGAMRG